MVLKVLGAVWIRRAALAGFVFAALAIASPQSSAGDMPVGLSGRPIVVPTAIVIYRHESLKRTDFVTPLMQRLRATLKPAVELRDAAFPYTATARNLLGQYDGGALIERFHQAQGQDAPPGAFKVLLIPDDITREPSNFLFAFNYGTETTDVHLSVVSLARLDDQTAGLPDATRAVRTAERVFKLITKNVARMGGFTGSGGCIMTFPRSVAELDLVPPAFCDDDARQLRQAGVLRP